METATLSGNPVSESEKSSSFSKENDLESIQPEKMTGTTSRMNTNCGFADYTPFRLSEIAAGTVWPEHIRDLLKCPTGEARQVNCKILCSEVIALLCHDALVEIGFIPASSTLSVTADEVCAMPNVNRVRRFGRQVDSDGYNSDAAIFAWKYSVVNVHRCATLKGTNEDVSVSAENDHSPSSSDVKKALYDSDLKSSFRDLFKYSYSSPCSVIMISKGTGIQVFCNFGNGEKSFQQSIEINMSDMFENETKNVETLRLPGDDWIKILNLNGIKFYSWFKKNFGALCLDSMNGLMFDQRSLVCLPPEVLVKIFAYSDIPSIRNARLTCKYLNDVADIPWLWRTLIRRDFGAAPSIPAQPARFARFFNRVPYELSPNIMSAQEDYKAIYEGQRRFNTTRPRFDAATVAGMGLGNRLGGRHSWLPYVTPPRPYIFRLMYDLPSPATARSELDTFKSLLW